MRVIGKSSLLRQFFRVSYKCSAVAISICGCISESLFRIIIGQKTLRSRQTTLHRWVRWLLRRLAVQVIVEGTPPEQGLIVSNHLSYLDILVFGSIAPCLFVSKREVRGWPGLGWAASLTGTIFIDRSRRTATHSIQPEIDAALAGGARLVLFPEGTSTNGSFLLPFHSSLFQPAVATRSPITAASISYELEEGDPRCDICYWGEMSLIPHALQLFSRDGVRAVVRFGKGMRIFTSRKEAAQDLWAEVNALSQQAEVSSDSATSAASAR